MFPSIKSIRAPLEWSILSSEKLLELSANLDHCHQPSYIDVALTINGITAQYHKNQHGDVFYIPSANSFDSMMHSLVIQCQHYPPLEQFVHHELQTEENEIPPNEMVQAAEAPFDPFLPQPESPLDLSRTYLHNNEQNEWEILHSTIPFTNIIDENVNSLEIQFGEIHQIRDGGVIDILEDSSDRSAVSENSEPTRIFHGEVVDAIYLSDMSDNEIESRQRNHEVQRMAFYSPANIFQDDSQQQSCGYEDSSSSINIIDISSDEVESHSDDADGDIDSSDAMSESLLLDSNVEGYMNEYLLQHNIDVDDFMSAEEEYFSADSDETIFIENAEE